MKDNKFYIIIASYNNENFVEYNLASVLNQTYEDYKVLYIDDASTDKTYEKVYDIVKEDPRFSIIKREENKGGTYNYFFELENFLDDDNGIIVHLDGDDWFMDENVLSNLNKFYKEKDVWMAYGGMYCYTGRNYLEEANPQNTPYPDFVWEHKLFRRDLWRASMMRTFRVFLQNSLDKECLYSSIDGKLYWHAADLAFQFAFLEMCGKDKVGVIDFPAYVYNQSKPNVQRTRERESVDNTKYELEIRNRKVYENGLEGKKLPQVNVIDYPMENNYIPKEFSFVYGQLDGEFDVTLLTDFSILKYINGEIKLKRGKVVADLHETNLYNPVMKETYEAVYKNSNMFDLILTYDPKLLTLPNAEKRMCMWRCLNKNFHTREWPLLADDSLYKIYEKTKNISCISSNKTFLEGHKTRVETVSYMLQNKKDNYEVDLFGKGYNEIVGKIEGLKDYRFSIAIENAYLENWATEKLSDCFLTGTIPIYYGCPNIGEMFDARGIISFKTKEELVEILKDVHKNGEKMYDSMKEYVQNNFKICDEWSLNVDQVFNKHIKKLIK